MRRLHARSRSGFTGKRALHGEADWMKVSEAEKLFPEPAASSIGERYRVDRDSTAIVVPSRRARRAGARGGKSPLLCFDGSFGSSHGIVFAGSGGFKTTSVTIPTALKWGGTFVVLDPSNEVAPMVIEHRQHAGRRSESSIPQDPDVGFNALDWIGLWRYQGRGYRLRRIMDHERQRRRSGGVRDDFFRASALQLLTAMIADVCLSGHTPKRTTRHCVRCGKIYPSRSPSFAQRLQDIYDNSASDFVKENVAAFVNMTPETFSGVYANAIKETHWLSYPNYAALVSGSSFSTDDVARRETLTSSSI
jgi:type IV secretion system protein VirD4